MSTNKHYRYFCLLTITIGTIFVYIFMIQFDSADNFLHLLIRNDHRSSSDRSQTRLFDSKKSDRWIVITTIQAPTSAIVALAADKRWQIVIVADQKTPIDWHYENCIFLSVDEQIQLNYSIHQLISYNSYTRKMIGYLYAIEHGAKWIYDTDDDNRPLSMLNKMYSMLL